MQEHNGCDNAILLHYGANFQFTKDKIINLLKDAKQGDILLVQGETNLSDFCMQHGKSQGMEIVFNTAPYPPVIGEEWAAKYPADWIIANETEALNIAKSIGVDVENVTREAMDEIMKVTEAKNFIVTLGSKGSKALIKTDEGLKFFECPAYKITPKDTTGAGDVFIGYFLTALIKNERERTSNRIQDALLRGSAAAALACMESGALVSCPSRDKVLSFIDKHRGDN